MSGGALASLVASLLMLALVASSFAARRVPMKDTVKMALGWIAIFAIGLLLYSLFYSDGSDTEAPAPMSNLA